MSEEVVDSIVDSVESTPEPVAEEVHPLDEALQEVEQSNEPPKFTVKINGEELEVTQDELLKGYQTNAAAQAKFQEAARQRREMEEAMNLAKQDPSVFFKAMGLDAREFAESLLTRQLEEELMTPEQREERARMTELEGYRASERERVEAQRQQEIQQLTAQVEQEIESEIVDTLTEAGIKPTPRVLARMAEIMLASIEDDGSRATAKQAYGSVRGELQADVHDFLQAHSVEELVTQLPRETVRALRQHFVNEVKAKVPARPTKATSKSKQEPTRRGVTVDDLFGKL